MPHAIPVGLMALDVHRASTAVLGAHGWAEKARLLAVMHQKIETWKDDPHAAASAVILAELAARDNIKRDVAAALSIPRRTFDKLLEELHLHEQIDEQAAKLGQRQRRGAARFGEVADS